MSIFQINTNVLSLNGQRRLFQTSLDLSKSMERLSSGLRINRAADDAAGLTAAEGMRSQLAGLRTSNDNVSRGISLLQTTDSALGQIGDMLARLKELAVQASDATLNDTNRVAIVTEGMELVTEMERLSENAKYNGIDLLNDTAGVGLTFFVGDGSAATQVISFLSQGVDIQDSDITGTASATDLAGTTAIDAAGVLTGASTPLYQTQGLAAGDTIAINGKRFILATVTGEGAATLKMELEGRLRLDDLQSDTITGIGTKFQSQLTDGDQIQVTGPDGTTETFFVGDIVSDTELTIGTSLGDQTALTASAASVAQTFTDVKGTLVAMVAITAQAMAVVDGGKIGSGAIGSDALAFEVEDMLTQTGALLQVARLDAAFLQVATLRARVGSVQNRMENSQASIQSMIEETSSAESVIRDADFAAEASAMSRSQILAQTGVAMLTQANVLPQLALSLLQ